MINEHCSWFRNRLFFLLEALYTYATLVAIEKPISEDVIYTMRQTSLAWKEIRTKLLVNILASLPQQNLFIIVVDSNEC